MKTCKQCKFPFGRLELSTVIRAYALIDVFRFLILLGPMLSLFYACTNIAPMPPQMVIGGEKRDVHAEDFVLYYGNRSTLSYTEQDMLADVQKSCSKDYRDHLPQIWHESQPTLYKALYLQGTAVVLPATSAVAFLVFHKKDLISSVLALVHFCFEIISMTLSLFGSYFISDLRLCFLGHFSHSVNIPALLWTVNIIFILLYKAGILYVFELYVRDHSKSKTFNYHPPTPSEELKSYLHELRSMGITPKVNVDLPSEPNERNWNYVSSEIKKILQEVRIQMAELHRDDPLVDDLLKSGKLNGQDEPGPRKRTGSTADTGGTGPNVLKIARMMASKNSEYKLLKTHQQNHGTGKETIRNRDEVEIILPERNFKFDPD